MNNDRDIFLAANLGSEVTRLLVAKKEHNTERMRGAYERACVIVEEIKMCADSGGQSESAVLRTVLDDLVRHNSIFTIQAETLTAYFRPFALKTLGI